MDPGTLAAANWLLTNIGLPILRAGVDQLMVQMGMKDAPITSARAQALVEVYIQRLEQHIQRVESKIDEDRLARLLAAMRQVSEAHKTNVERDYLVNALNTFHVVTNYPERGTTGEYTNAQLRCIGFLGMAAAHAALNEPQQLVAEKMAEAVYSDIDTARQWLGNNLVNQIVSRFPAPGIICPQCGFQNPAGSKFCNRDGYPLDSGQKPPSRLSSQTSILQLIRQAVYMSSLRAFQIYLDDKKVGAVRNGKSSTFDVQAGHHTLRLRIEGLPLERLYSSPIHAFDIASGEKVTFICQAGGFSIRLWKL